MRVYNSTRNGEAAQSGSLKSRGQPNPQKEIVAMKKVGPTVLVGT